MKNNSSAALSFLLILGLVAFSFYTHKPQAVSGLDTPADQFSAQRALQHLKKISEQPHSVGTEGHALVRDYIVGVLEEMGLEVQLQEGLAYTPGWGAMSEATNIIARIEGSGSGKAVLLMSHYDSAPHTVSHGASDAGSGVVAVLEATRAFLAKAQKPKNDIIILFTDGEELGLNGASVFVDTHPWAKDVGVALNFEARGSGGPSNMIVETNGGNEKLIKAFARAGLTHPYANSLMYSIYKILPNDTDSTVLREEGDIDGYFFAFIGDHFDYHTAMDRYDRLDPLSLEHQGRYALPLLDYFASDDLDLKSDTDYVYFNFPIIKMVYFPFWMIWPLVIGAWILLILVTAYGKRKQAFSWGQVGRSFFSFLISLAGCGLITYLGWMLVSTIHPEYQDILQGFTYNGYIYLSAFVALNLAFTFWVYKLFQRPKQAAGLSLAPLFFWLVISTLMALYLPGAAFFVIPVYFGVLCVYLIASGRVTSLFWLTILCAPAIFIVTHYIKEFPVGLGLKMLTVSAVFTVLFFGLLLPVMGHYRFRGRLSAIFLLVAVGCFISAETQASFTPQRPHPTSLNYVYDVDAGQAYWATNNHTLDAWLTKTLGEDPEPAAAYFNQEGTGKYGSGYTFAKPAEKHAVAPSSIYMREDTVVGQLRKVHFTIYPQRAVGDMTLSAKVGMPFQSLSFNGKEVKKSPDEPYIFSDRRGNTLLNYRVVDNEPLDVEASVPVGVEPQFELLDYSYDLMDNPDFGIEPRPENSIPMPFVYTDAIITKQTIQFDTKQ